MAAIVFKMQLFRLSTYNFPLFFIFYNFQNFKLSYLTSYEWIHPFKMRFVKSSKFFQLY